MAFQSGLKAVIEFIGLRQTYAPGENVNVTYRVLDSLAIHSNDRIVITDYPKVSESFQMLYFCSLVSQNGFGVNRSINVCMPPRASEREGYTICYISGCDHATLGMSEQFNIKEIQDDNLTEQWLRRENHAEDSTNKKKYTPLPLRLRLETPKQHFEQAGVVDELIKYLDDRKSQLKNSGNVDMSLHEMFGDMENAIKKARHTKDEDGFETNALKPIFDRGPYVDDVSIERTLDIIERAALLDKIAAIGTEFEREYPSRDQAIRDWRLEDDLVREFKQSQNRDKEAIKLLTERVNQSEIQLEQIDSDDRQKRQLDYQRAVEQHETKMGEMSKAVQALEERKKHVQDVQKTVKNSRKIYMNQIETLKTKIGEFDSVIEQLEAERSSSSLCNEDDYLNHIQSLTLRLDEADGQVAKIRNQLTSHKSETGNTKGKKMRLENSEEYLRRQLIGLQKSKSSEPTRAPGEKRKVASSELSHTRGGNKRLTQSDMGTVALINEDSPTMKLLLKLLTTSTPPAIPAEWFDGNHTATQGADIPSSMSTDSFSAAMRRLFNTGSDVSVRSKDSDESLAVAMRRLFRMVSEEKAGDSPRSVTSSESFARVMRQLFATSSNERLEKTKAPDVQSKMSTESFREAMRRLFREASDQDMKGNKISSTTSLTDSQSFARIMRKLFDTKSRESVKSVTSSESFARVMRELFTTGSEQSLGESDSSTSFDWGNFRALFDSDTSLDTVVDTSTQKAPNAKDESDLHKALYVLKTASKEELHDALPSVSDENLRSLQDAMRNLMSDVNEAVASHGKTTPKSSDESVARAVAYLLRQLDSEQQVTKTEESNSQTPISINSNTMTDECQSIDMEDIVAANPGRYQPHNFSSRVKKQRLPCFSMVSPLSALSVPTNQAQTRCSVPSSFTFSWPQSAMRSQTQCHTSCKPALPESSLMFSSHFARESNYGTFNSEIATKQDRTPAFISLTTECQATEAVTHSAESKSGEVPKTECGVYDDANCGVMFKRCKLSVPTKTSAAYTTKCQQKKQPKARRRLNKRKRSNKD